MFRPHRVRALTWRGTEPEARGPISGGAGSRLGCAKWEILAWGVRGRGGGS